MADLGAQWHLQSRCVKRLEKIRLIWLQQLRRLLQLQGAIGVTELEGLRAPVADVFLWARDVHRCEIATS